MKKSAVCILLLSLLCTSFAYAGLREDVEAEARDITSTGPHSGATVDLKTIIAGLKEALSLGVRNGVANVAQRDGYFGNQLIKILVPEKMQKITDGLRETGFHTEADQFELSMNRAAEKAAPMARQIFIDAIKTITIHDAETILRGSDTAATDYLKSKTYDRIYGKFKPAISSAMKDVGVTRYFQELMDAAKTIPLLKDQTVDLNHYVTSKALDGLFLMVGEEEKKIRKDPAARGTKLLKTVFE